PDGKENSNWPEDDGIDGWRLDVLNNLENQMFLKEWQHVVKKCKKEAYITAELWSNAGDDINTGDKFDAVMNYELLKAVIGYFINQGKDFNESY
ncbi:alpha-amylase family glycosyl hydrolase, partial [Streptobacillus moniliformis]|uniref:alpha-amylase family glycosyl hydrolase n=1 Tax=Streptobacillus moniliformis TaxID=34105 RepID=UPI000AF054E6